jgi:glycosyltransferase involved in cell wall biosynthesis
MRILQVVHSFIPYTMAGTEIYSYKLSKELARRHEIFIFFRINDTKKHEYHLKHQRFESLETYTINNTFKSCASFHDTYRNNIIDTKFGELLDRIKPDIVHIQHLLFLSHGIIDEIKKRKIPVLYTLHDYWLICYRGQLIKRDLTICSRNSILECRDCLKYLLSIRKYSMYFYRIFKKSLPSFLFELIKKSYFNLANTRASNRIEEFQKSTKEILSKIDLFIAPSNFIKNKFIDRGFPEHKILYSPNGYDYRNFLSPSKSESKILRFGYIGTLLPTKGLNILISAFREVKYKNVELSIYGKLFPYSGFEYYPNLFKKMIKKDNRIKYKGEYDNKDICKILADIDILIVPSIWLENAPLVIQEAFMSKTPVIASRIGGIPELINDGINGLLFNPGNADDLQKKIEYIIDNPDVIEKFRENMPEVKSIEDNAREMEGIYNSLIAMRKS